jgi:hypothetical protein
MFCITLHLSLFGINNSEIIFNDLQKEQGNMEHRITITELVIKPVEKLVSFLTSKPKNIIPRDSNQKEIQTQSTLKKSTLVAGLAWYAMISLTGGLIGIIAIKGFVPSYLPALAESMFLDSVFDMFLGALIFISAQVLAKGKVLAIWLYGSAILMDSIFNIAMGYKLNYILIGFGLLFIWQMVKRKNEWELA